MNRHTLWILVIALFFLALPSTGHAFVVNRPFGGRVIATTSSAITCAAQYGPLTIQPVTFTPPTPYYITMGMYGAPRNGGWILGLYNPIPMVGQCYNTQSGVPIPAFSISGTKYGVSK